MGEKARNDLKQRAASCPTCDGPVEADATSTPFCSERCRLADLNKWMVGEYRVSREMKETDLDELES